MARKRSLYPPSPADVPPDLTLVTGAYQLRVCLLLSTLILFLLLYVGLVVLSGYLIVLAIVAPLQPGAKGLMIFLRIVVAILASFIFVFLVKGFFKRGQTNKSLEVEIFEEDHPRLFAFLECLCEETGAP